MLIKKVTSEILLDFPFSSIENRVPVGEIRILGNKNTTGPLKPLLKVEKLFDNPQIKTEEILPNIYLTKTPNGDYIQTNILTLSTKYHLMQGLKYLPKYVILNGNMYDKKHGGNYGNFEFLVYLNFYAKQFILNKTLSGEEKKTTIVCSEKTRKRIEKIWQETYNGPTLENLIKGGMDREFAEMFIKELDYFAEKDPATGKLADINTFINFITFDKNNEAVLDDDLKIIRNGTHDSYRFVHQEKEFEYLKATSNYKPPVLDTDFYDPDTVTPHEFATTVIGGGSGFTPELQTASFVQWNHFKGTIIDGPEFPNIFFPRAGVDFQDIVRFHLTHLHADHVSIFYWLLPEYIKGNITWEIWTTRPIFESLLRTLSAVTNAPIEKLNDILGKYFKEMVPGKKYPLKEGGYLEVDYSLHSIPSLKSKFTRKVRKTGPHGETLLDHQGRPIFEELTMTYSGDTIYDPDFTSKLVKEGSMSQGRKDAADDFVFTGGVIMHEMAGGIPHTDQKPLLKYLSPEQLKRILVYHFNTNKIASELNIAKEGFTYGLMDTPILDKVEKMLVLLDRSTFFSQLPIEQKISIAKLAQAKEFKKGERIVTEGHMSDKIYFIHSGTLDVYKKGLGPNVARMNRYDTFGEAGLKNLPRAASVFAQTNGILYCIDGSVLREIIPENVLDELLVKQLEHRPFFGSHKLFKGLPLKVKQHIANQSKKQEFNPGDVILEMDVHNDSFAVFAEGEAEVFIKDGKTKNGELIKVATIKPNDFVGEMSLMNNEKTKARIIAKTPCKVFLLNGQQFRDLRELSPQFSYGVLGTSDKRTKENEEAMNIFNSEDDD